MRNRFIVSFKGQLSDEWNSPEKACVVEIHEKEVIIKSRVVYKEYDISDLDLLNFEIVTEDKKVLFVNKKIEYVSIKVDGVQIPKIVLSSYELDQIIKEINDFKVKIRLQEEIELKEKQESLTILESLKSDILSNYCGLDYYLNDFGFTAKYLELFGAKEDTFYDFFLSLYKQINKDTNGSHNINLSNYTDSQYIRKFISAKTGVLVFKDYELGVDNSFVLKKIDVFKKSYLWFFERDYLELMDGQLDELFDDIEDKYSCSLIVLYHLALALNIIFSLNRKVNEVVKGDIKTIIDNLVNSESVDNDYIIEKTFSIYNNFESNGTDVIGYIEFKIILNIYLNNNYEILYELYKIYEEIIEGINFTDIELNSNSSFLQYVENMLMSIDVGLFFNTDMISEPKEKSLYKVFVNNFLYVFYKVMPIEYIEIIICNKFRNFVADTLYNRDVKEQLRLEKNRLLRGDLTQEIHLFNDKLLYDSVRTGYEFEEYLKTLFTNHGYRVEVTKKSCDQGADLVLQYKGEKIVAQAKFYSKPVGNKAVQEVVSAIAFYQADKGIVVTNNKFTPAAIELANANNVDLIDGSVLDIMRIAVQKSV